MDVQGISDSRVAVVASRSIRDAWAVFADRFRIVTRRARRRFEECDWAGMAADHVERLDLYSRAVDDTEAAVRSLLGGRVEDRHVWTGMKAVYSGLIQDRSDWELAETFFNSVTRRIFATVGVDPRIEFVDTDYDGPPVSPPEPIFNTYQGGEPVASLLARILLDAGFEVPFVRLDDDAARAAARLGRRLRQKVGADRVDRVDVASSMFYRGKGAYVVCRVVAGEAVVPLVLALLHGEDGIVVDAALVTENQVSILFSFTRSYFHIDTACPNAMVQFLATLMPRKRRAELYISLGHNKHGKTELYRELRRHLFGSRELFESAQGTPGLVMVVFTLPGFDVVVKVIRDRFGAPKQLTRDHVLSRYRLVFRHDRAGRLVDAQEYEHLEFPQNRFDPALLETLLAECGRSVGVKDEMVHLSHAYLERRVTPLDVHLGAVSEDEGIDAVVDFGQAIKDLAASGIFPGDLLLKNFGVTRHGRVVFYDYDELTTLDECVFRALPVSSSYEDEMSAEPWFSVGPHDVFPQEFATFLGLQGKLRAAFVERHADLFDAASWREWQRRVTEGEMMDLFPYDESVRLAAGASPDRRHGTREGNNG
jgi:isocitrate dehydrogenase kinase/phosphatase